VVSLGLHGLSSLLIAVGLVNVQRATGGASPLGGLGWAGVAAAVLGLMVLLPLLALGLVLIGLVSCLARRWVGSGVALIVGATVLVVGYLPPDGRIGTEGVPAPRLEIKLVLATALVLIAVGLVLTGNRRLRWVPKRPLRVPSVGERTLLGLADCERQARTGSPRNDPASASWWVTGAAHPELRPA
jgi:hypothetical protein